MMMAPTRVSKQVSSELIRLLSAPEGSEDWAQGMLREIHVCMDRSRKEQVHIIDCLQAIHRSNGWRHLRTARGANFRSFASFCQAARPYGLGLTAEQAQTLLEQKASIDEDGDGQASPLIPAGDAPWIVDRSIKPNFELARHLCSILSIEDRERLIRWLDNQEI